MNGHDQQDPHQSTTRHARVATSRRITPPITDQQLWIDDDGMLRDDMFGEHYVRIWTDDQGDHIERVDDPKLAVRYIEDGPSWA